jgi:type III pantothenate kinase
LLLAADIGNTQTVLGVFEGEELRANWRMATESFRSPDEVGSSVAGLLSLRGFGLSDVGSVIVSSDVPPLVRAYRNFAEELVGVPFLSVSHRMETGLKILYDEPGALGVDRIVNSVAAGRYHGFPAFVVDFGTGTTVDAVDAGASYLGGALLPGVSIALDALVSRAAKLYGIDLEDGAPNVIATNTPDAIRSGFIYGYAGAIDALIRRMRDELGFAERFSVIATGGLASVIARHCQEIEIVDEDLTLKGLYVLHEMNAGR